MQVSHMHFYFFLLQTFHVAWMSLIKINSQTASARDSFTELTFDLILIDCNVGQASGIELNPFNFPCNCIQDLIHKVEFYTDMHDG